MSIKTRGIIFITFFLNCIVIGLLVASLTTDHWIHSSPKRHNSTQADGQVHFGLFSGQKFLSVGYGIRPHTLDGMNCEMINGLKNILIIVLII